jgi:hypothetical protein
MQLVVAPVGVGVVCWQHQQHHLPVAAISLLLGRAPWLAQLLTVVSAAKASALAAEEALCLAFQAQRLAAVPTAAAAFHV